MTEYLNFEGAPPATGEWYYAVTELGCCIGETHFDTVWFDVEDDVWRNEDGELLLNAPVEWEYLT